MTRSTASCSTLQPRQPTTLILVWLVVHFTCLFLRPHIQLAQIWLGPSRADPVRFLQCPDYLHPRTALIYFHGNADDIGVLDGMLKYTQEQIGAHILAVEYPGYGLCPGRPCESELYRVASQAFDFATQALRIPRDQVG